MTSVSLLIQSGNQIPLCYQKNHSDQVINIARWKLQKMWRKSYEMHSLFWVQRH